MGWLDALFGKKQPTKSRPEGPRTVMNLQVDDIVTYDLEDYIVVGKIVYEDSGYTWTVYNMKGDSRYIWLSAEMDDVLELGIYERVPTQLSGGPQEEINVEGTVYYLEERSTAQIREVVGQAGARVGQRVEYWDYESDDEKYLSVERWGGDLEVSRGYAIKERELKIIAGS